MKPTEINQAIAEHQGAQIIEKQFPGTHGPRTGKKWAWNGNESTPCGFPGGGLLGWGWNLEAIDQHLPDYYSDLNDIHAAVMTLDYDQCENYERCLARTSFRDRESTKGERPRMFLQMNATAAQRAEAFLRTVGRWVDSD